MPHRTSDDARVRADARDRGLRRVRTATGWITVASAAGAVVLAGGYAQALPGKSSASAKPPTSSNSSSRSSPSSPSSPSATVGRTGASNAPSSAGATTAPTTSSAPAPVLQAPTQAPAQAPTTAASTHTTSGGS
ncbi:hypothetical protein [Actinospica sp.]|uniref:hypothetical protein n=1 Tax=Actinospica sp. TaxID=1872142 RepID=UPI002CCF5C84|nr:hypothetical protein [Actinospica sp.]HWG28867.1 hypothetical protein [Actinospica sp.]